jgi:Tfp pilus assembly protein PilN
MNERNETNLVTPTPRALCIVVGALAIGSTCAVMQYARHASAQLQARAMAADRAWADAAAQARAVEDLRQTEQGVTRHAELAEMLLEKTPGSAILAEVTNALPAGCWLSEFAVDSADGPASEAVNVRIAGYAPDDAQVGQYINRLRRSKQFNDVKLSAIGSDTQRVRRFSIDMCVSGSGPAAQPTQTASIAR